MKKTIISIAYSAALIIAIALTSTSCKREPLHEPFSNYYLQLEGDYEAQHIKPTVPGMYEAVFYDKGTHNEIGQSYLSPEGGYIFDLSANTYEMLVYGFDSGNTKVTGLRNFNDATASTERYTEGDTLSYNAPDHLMVAHDVNFEIPFLYDRDEVYTLYGYPKTLVETWCVVITGIKGLENAVSIDLYITGQARTKTLGTQELSSSEMAIHFPGTIEGTGKMIYTPFCTFGKLSGKRSTLRLVIMDPNQKKIVCHADVTDQFDNPDNVGHWICAHFDIEIDPKKDGGMQPDVNEWGTNEFYYDIH